MAFKFLTKKTENQMLNNYDPSRWVKRLDSMEIDEIPLGQLGVAYQFDADAVKDWNEMRKSSAEIDGWWRGAEFKYTESAIYFSPPSGGNPGYLIPYTFGTGQRVPFSSIDQIDLASGSSKYTELTISSKEMDFSVKFELSQNQVKNAQCLISVWKSARSVEPYLAMAVAIGDPRIKYLAKAMSYSMKDDEISECKSAGQEWANISEIFLAAASDGTSKFQEASTLYNFSSSNMWKLLAIWNPKSAVSFLWPTPEYEQSMHYSQLIMRFSLDFEEDLLNCERIFGREGFSSFERPENFDALLEVTRRYLSSPRGEFIFAN